MWEKIDPSRRSVLTASALGLPLTACGGVGVPGIVQSTPWQISVERDIKYGRHDSQKLDIYRAAATHERQPLALIFHGGFWQFGAKDELPMQTIASHLAARGINTISAGYRLYPQTDSAGILEDAASAVAWAVNNGERLGARAGSVVVCGYSAGAWMGAMLQTRPELLHRALGMSGAGRNPIKGFVGIAGPYGNWPTNFPLLGRLFSDVPDEERLPNTFIKSGIPPAALIQGMLDLIVLPQNAISFANSLRSQGNYVETHMYPLRDHLTILPMTGLLPGSLMVIGDMYRFITSDQVRMA